VLQIQGISLNPLPTQGSPETAMKREAGARPALPPQL
jgi:hypothetical protein